MTADVPQSPDAPAPKRRVPVWRWAFYTITLLGVLAAIVVPNVVKARGTECKNACVNLLRQIDGAKEQWALEMKLPEGTPADANAIAQYIKGGWPACPGGGVLTAGAIGAPPLCTLPGHSL